MNEIKTTIPASCETSMKKAKIAAKAPVTIVLFTGTSVRGLMSEKNEGSKPSLAIAMRTRGFMN